MRALRWYLKEGVYRISEKTRRFADPPTANTQEGGCQAYHNKPPGIIAHDLADFSSIKRYNNQVLHIIVAVDHFSKRLWTFPLKYKEPKHVVKCLSKVISDYAQSPWKLGVVGSDNGAEFQEK
jgi:hypothetical protein